MLIIVHKLIKL